VLERPSLPLTTPEVQVRHRCRNPRCGGKLKSPTDSRLDAFCCSSCFKSFFRSHCLVCERLIARKTERRQICDRPKCRHEIERHRERFSGGRYLASVLGHNALRSARLAGLKNSEKSGRAFRIVAGPELSPTSLRLATLPLDPELAARLERAHAGYVENRTKAKRRAARQALIKRHHPPVNLLGGYRFLGAPTLDLSPIAAPQWAVLSQWKPTGRDTAPPIPDFLIRIPTVPFSEAAE
jgi:hypothetical protein